MARYQYLLFSDPLPGREDEFNLWYDQQHVGDVLKVPGFVSAQRLRCLADSNPTGCRYLAIYELETDDPQATLDDLQSRAGSAQMPISGALDVAKITAALWLPIIDKQNLL